MQDFSKNNIIESEYIVKQIQSITQNDLEGYSPKEALSLVLSCVDYTTLEGSDTDDKIMAMCNRVLRMKETGLPSVAAVCVYPTFVRLAKLRLSDSGIRVASVAGAFPAGQSPLKLKLEEVKYAVCEGADEIDMVLSRGKFIEGKYSQVFDEIAAIKEQCKSAYLKVILETGELGSLTNIRIASDIAINAGADFIKTSTGKITQGASEEAVYVMLQAIKDHYNETGIKIGIKPSGGISDTGKALNYAKLIYSMLGKEWLNNKLFRIGASRLVDSLEEELSGK